MVRRAVEVRPGGGVLRIRLPCRLQDRDHAAGGRLRREVHEGWPLGLEGDWRRNQTHRGGIVREWRVGTPPRVGFKSLRLADSDSPKIPVQWVEQVVGFSRDDRARHRKHGSALQECGVFALTTSTTTRSMPTAKASKE